VATLKYIYEFYLLDDRQAFADILMVCAGMVHCRKSGDSFYFAMLKRGARNGTIGVWGIISKKQLD
jgi:hypothetical protein